MTNPRIPEGLPEGVEIPESLQTLMSELQRLVTVFGHAVGQKRGQETPDNNAMLDALIEVLYGNGELTKIWKESIADAFPEGAKGLETFFQMQMRLNGKTREALEILKVFDDADKRDGIAS